AGVWVFAGRGEFASTRNCSEARTSSRASKARPAGFLWTWAGARNAGNAAGSGRTGHYSAALSEITEEAGRKTRRADRFLLDAAFAETSAVRAGLARAFCARF